MITVILCVISLSSVAETKTGDTVAGDTTDTFYQRRVKRAYHRWNKLIPTQLVIQNAGNMGVISSGIGWNYGRHKQWETNLLLGFIPENDSRRAKMTITLKENFMPWRIYIPHGWCVEPLSCGIYLNTVVGDEFWGHEPNRYPKSYYEYMSTRVRINVFLGQRITKDIPHNRRKFIKSVTCFYEISTCDLYIRDMVMSDYVKLGDIIGLSLGVKLQMF